MSLPCEAYAIDEGELRNQASKTLLSNLNRNMVPAKNITTTANHVLKNGRHNTLLGKNMIYYKSTNHILKGETVSDQDGVILKGGRKVIPSSLRDEKKEATLSTLTRDILVWPAMSQELRQVVGHYQLQVIRRRHQNNTKKVKCSPAAKIGVDLFELKGTNYLVTVDYYSNFTEIAYLSTKTTN